MERWSAWMTRSTAVGSVGVCALVLLWGPSQLLGFAVPVTLIVAVAHVLPDENRARRRPLAVCASILRVSSCAIAVFVSASVSAELSPALGVLVLAAFAATSPPARRVLRRRDANAPAPRETGLGALTDEELCREWRRTSEDLGRCRDASERLTLVITRSHLLDEIWTRDRTTLEAWVEYGARSTEGTRHFFDPQ